MGPKVTYLGLKLTYMRLKLTYMGLKLIDGNLLARNVANLDATFGGINSVHMFLEL